MIPDLKRNKEQMFLKLLAKAIIKKILMGKMNMSKMILKKLLIKMSHT